MPRPRVLILQDLGEREGCIAIGHAADGQFSGDNWYPNREEAKVAESQYYGFSLGDWRLCETDDLDTAIVAALHYAKDVAS
jgi:hypothetical protein